MALSAISPAGGTNARIDSLGLDLQSLLQIILTQLSYQDPLKPVENFEFISQLAQFTSLEQSRQISEKVDTLLSIQGSTQAIGLLGKTVDISGTAGSQTGIVQSISFKNGQPELTLKVGDDQFLPNVLLSQIESIR
ncbi:MAG: flagellar hook capping protein [Bordetella sp. SCN 67-23]|nr:flagellar hook capping protein [Burkholderiales bacterium]ODS72352.1 MAG: flagellar hook capping protein [Bordetella sp. SCN 67-23]OJW86868.1 MAG: flagellar hook capping protein [Burkholderiales bacterium 67-32]